MPVHHPCLRQTNTKSKRKGSLFINHLHSPDLLDAGAAKKCRNQFSEISDNVASIFSGPFPFWRTVITVTNSASNMRAKADIRNIQNVRNRELGC